MNNALLRKKNNYQLVDVKEPQLFRETFPYSEVPKIYFDNQIVQPSIAEDIWITDTTFRDGQQARPPYKPEQIVRIFDMLSRLSGKNGVIRQSEFFLYSRRDRESIEGCLALNHRYPEITGWIRADSKDLELVKSFGLKETGILTSVSDYHIYLKLKKKRKTVMEDYLAIVESALESDITPRCHFEDLTRADIYGFCLPFAEKLLRLMEDSKKKIKIRMCDTMGYGLSFPGVELPRSVPKLAYAFNKELGYPSDLLEWHGHNDFHKVHINGATAWLYGVSALNATILGYGERTGNPPLEGAVIEYIGLRGSDNGMDTRVITELAEYYSQNIKADIPRNFPFVGEDFNTTRAGIHADGLLKNEEIYNIFDTSLILDRPLKVTVTDKSGVAGIARWLNENIPTVIDGTFPPISKRHSGIAFIQAWVAKQYEQGRTTSISPEEIIVQAKHYLPSLFISEFAKIKQEVSAKGQKLAHMIAGEPVILSLLQDSDKLEEYLGGIVKREGSIQLIAITNPDGFRISQVYTQHGEKALFRNLLNKNFNEHEWFIKVKETGKPYYSDLYFSKYTNKLIITAALPIYGEGDKLLAIVDIDFKFAELTQLLTRIPDEILALQS